MLAAAVILSSCMEGDTISATVHMYASTPKSEAVPLLPNKELTVVRRVRVSACSTTVFRTGAIAAVMGELSHKPS